MTAGGHLPDRAVRTFQWVAVLVFLLHAGTYLYFFVDDEAIPYTYAQNLLAGRGLTYNPAEGRVEGYSAFLHVVFAAGVLAATSALSLPPLSVFMLGKFISIACGAAIVWLAAATLLKLGLGTRPSLVATLGATALAGPLAVWSCSSLEAVPFALGVALLVHALCREQPASRLAIAAAVFLALERTDGWVWAGGVGAAYMLMGSRDHRRVAFLGVLLPAGLVTVGMELFRLAYFGAWAPMPVYAKVLFKLQDNGQLVTKMPAVSYAAAFGALYGLVPLALAGVLALRGAARRPELRALLLSVLALAAYVAKVGDWMFGFRFFVPLIAPAAILVGASLALWPRGVRWGVALACVGWCGLVAHAFEREYLQQPLEVARQNFWATRSLERARFFGPYYGLVQLLRPVVPPGTSIAYNQAGLIPFALDAPNIDNLGTCSRFYAQLPATDVAYTEVGRYEALTAAPVISARRAYLLNRAPRFLVERTDLLQRSNGGRIPDTLFGGYFTLFALDEGGYNAVYRWAGRSAERFRRDPGLFLENIAHVSNIDRAVVGSTVIRGKELLPALPFLRERKGRIVANPAFGVTLRIRRPGTTARQLYIGGVSADGEADLSITLRSADGGITCQHHVTLPTGRSSLDHWLPAAVPASVVELRITARGDKPVRVVLTDVRVMGQTPALLAFVKAHVPFEGSAGSPP